MSKLLTTLALALAFAALSAGAHAAKLLGKSDHDSYVVIMHPEPVIAYEGDIRGYPATRPGQGHKINPNSAHVRKYQRFLEKGHRGAMQRAGVPRKRRTHDYTMALNGFAVRMSHEEAGRLAMQKDVALVIPDELQQPMTENSPEYLELTAPGGPYLKGYDGENVVVGVIDTGIWPEHPSFADDGSYTPLDTDVPCEFGNTAHHPDDQPFDCNGKLLGARDMATTYRALIGADPDEFWSARDDSGHGTHTASTAAGNAGVQATIFDRDFGDVAGIAPRARIIAYKGLGKLGGFGSDLAAAIDQAVADGVDVINYSIGSSSFAIGADDVAFLFAADAGVHVATSNGNSGPEAATIGSPASIPWVTSVGASTQNRTFQGSVTTGAGAEYFGASITGGSDELPLVDAAAAGDALCNPGALDPAMVAGNIVLCLRGEIARVAKSEAVAEAGGAGMILYNADDADTRNTDLHLVPSVHVNNTDGLAIKTYIAATAEPTARIAGGAFSPIEAPWMAAFSSRGPNLLTGDIIKPDVTAPGVNILAGNTPISYDPGAPGQLFQAISGTSMSSPHVAGLLALLEQAHPDWTPAMAKSALMTTAHQGVSKEDGVSDADPFDMGAGHVEPGGQAIKNSVFEPGLAYDAGLLDYVGYTCGAELGIFTAASCDFVASVGVPLDPSDLNIPSVGIDALAGTQTVRRVVTSIAGERGWRTYTADIDAPPGYDVSVTPSSLRLKSGQSAAYELTVTNVGAPVGEWRFGSLTWSANDGLFAASSPLAVKASLFDAPEEIAGSGVDDAVSFEVTMGYTGPYTAAAHGLVPASRITDTVAQDPDQSFDPGDGFSNAHTFTAAGDAMLRFRIPPEATEADADLDLFLFAPDGSLQASSTNAGTDESIDVRNPADGTWTLFVHGWQAPGGDSDYELFAWTVSATPGGNLTVDSAPGSATLGETATVEASWSGAAAGEWHLGAISHEGAAGVMGLTLIEVDNR